jgi:hypothetical protein
LNNLLGKKNFLNTSEIRETAAFWILKSHPRPYFEVRAKYLDRNKAVFVVSEAKRYLLIDELRAGISQFKLTA